MRFWLKGAGVIFVAVIAIFLAFPHRELEWVDTVVPMAQRYTGVHDSSQPLNGTTIVITGATNGIGLSLTRALSKLGATVVALGRSKERLVNLQKEIPSVQIFQMDLSDLADVARTANEILENVPSIDILVNNAGMHATSDIFAKYASVGGDRSYDRVFVVNYLSHFLLTEKLAGVLSQSKKPVIVQTSSSFHWAVDGSDLIQEGKNGALPVAAQPGGSQGFFIFRTQRSYANSKLAQILHARALKHMHPELQAARIVSFCPGWVATNIAGSGSFATAILDKAAFPMEEWGIASALYAILDDNDSDYYINSKVFNVVIWLFPRATAPWVYRYGVRDAVLYVGAMLLLWIQNLAPYAGPSRSSPESYNMTKATALYDWSLSAVGQYLWK